MVLADPSLWKVAIIQCAVSHEARLCALVQGFVLLATSLGARNRDFQSWLRSG